MTNLRLVLLATTALTAMQFASVPSQAQTAPIVLAQAAPPRPEDKSKQPPAKGAPPAAAPGVRPRRRPQPPRRRRGPQRRRRPRLHRRPRGPRRRRPQLLRRRRGLPRRRPRLHRLRRGPHAAAVSAATRCCAKGPTAAAPGGRAVASDRTASSASVSGAPTAYGADNHAASRRRTAPGTSGERRLRRQRRHLPHRLNGCTADWTGLAEGPARRNPAGRRRVLRPQHPRRRRRPLRPHRPRRRAAQRPRRQPAAPRLATATLRAASGRSDAGRFTHTGRSASGTRRAPCCQHPRLRPRHRLRDKARRARSRALHRPSCAAHRRRSPRRFPRHRRRRPPS